MKFVFRLEAFYRLRKEEERQAQIELGRQQKEKVILEQALASIIEEERHWADVYNSSSSLPSAGHEMVLTEQYLIVLEDRRRFQNVLIRKKEEDVRKAQMVVAAAFKARKQIELLREKHKEAFDLEEHLQEKRQAMEMAQLRFVYQMAENREI
jgi:flagellar export protein FliJ